MSEAAGNFDFMALGQAIMDARERRRITREELAEELGISARHLQAVEKEEQNPSFPLFIHSACDHVPHIRRPIHTPRPPDRENHAAPTVGRTL